ncbi:plasma-membrane choline transporter-domain-containing protein [Coniella lustricola]|uniref:Protein PNS1 n=1 Tax=Coniella lustricola TaxID=2025994 RepID=A0A2T3A1T0_9PEZI|nr:plasma-membrane choline transporter-domain-containing protein [Coniella lustricola]
MQQQQYPPPNPEYQQYPPSYGGYAAVPDQGSHQQQQQQQQQQFRYGDDSKIPFDQAFKIERPKYNDVWAGVLFLAFMAGFTVVSGIALRSYATTRSSNGTGIYDADALTINTSTLLLFLFCLAVALVFSIGYVFLIRIAPRQIIWITGILNIVWGLGTAIYMLYRKQYVGGIIFLVFVVFLMFAFWSWRKRIPFSALMLRTSINVANHYGHVYMISLVGGLIAAAYAVWFSITFVAIYNKWSPSNNNPSCASSSCSYATVTGLVVFITFTSFWFSEWIKNTIHTTIAGIYGSWYYNSRAYPTGVTRGALRRSLTYSFGSISLGSLVVAIVNFLKMLAQSAQNDAAQQGDLLAFVFSCILTCLISCLQWVIEFVNRYAFSHIALYGRPYFQSAKDTWKMIKDRGIDALINECLIGPVFSFGSLFIGFATALLAFLYLEFTNPAYNSNGDFTVVICAFAFLIGLQICNIFTTPLSSGIDTIFVAMAWDPEVMIRDHPDLYQQLVQVYPHVQQAIHA